MTAVAFLLGAYLVLVGWHGHAAALGSELASDLPAAGKWLAAVLILMLVYSVMPPRLRVYFGGVLGVAALVFFIKGWPKINAGLSATMAAL